MGRTSHNSNGWRCQYVGVSRYDAGRSGRISFSWGTGVTPGKVAVVLACAWLGLTLLFQFRPLSRRFQTLDRLGILPRWLFFTQGVGSYALTVEVRMRDSGGVPSDWVPAPLWPTARWWHAMYHPHHATTGAIWNAVDRLAHRAARGDSDATLAQTQAFAALSTYLRRALPPDDLQIALLRTDQSSGESRRLFVSEFLAP